MATQKNNNDSFNQATPQKKRDWHETRQNNTPKTIDFKMKTNAASQSRRRLYT